MSVLIFSVLIVSSAFFLYKNLSAGKESKRKEIVAESTPDVALLQKVPLTALVGVSKGAVTLVLNGELANYVLHDTTKKTNILIWNCIVEFIGKAGVLPKNIAFLATCTCSATVLDKVAKELKEKLDLDAKSIGNFDEKDLVLLGQAPVKAATANKPSAPAVVNGARPRMCYTCKKMITEKKPSQCAACKAIIYCSAECAKSDWAQHKGVCPMFKKCVASTDKDNLHDFSFEWYDKQNIMYDYKIQEFLDANNLSTKGLYQIIGAQKVGEADYGDILLNLYSDDAEVRADNFGLDEPLSAMCKDVKSADSIKDWTSLYDALSIPKSSAVAFLLQYPMTVFHIIKNFAFKQKELPSRLTIHLLGAERECEFGAMFEVLLYLLKTNIDIHFYGPLVKPGLRPFSFSSGTHKLNVFFHSTLYTPEEKNKPDLLIAMNAGLLHHQEWVPAIRTVVQLKWPTFFTETLEISVLMMLPNFQAIGTTVKNVSVNPFRNPLAEYRDDLNFLGWQNGWLIAI